MRIRKGSGVIITPMNAVRLPEVEAYSKGLKNNIIKKEAYDDSEGVIL